MSGEQKRFLKLTRGDHALGRVVSALTRMGFPLAGSRVLEVRGRSSGEIRAVPVNPLKLDGAVYLVSPRGHTQWVRNLRVAGEGTLRRGRHSTRFRATEVDDAEKTAILRAYLKAWAWEVGRFFEGVDSSSSDERLAEVAPGFPAFRIERIAGRV